ncbi:3-(3-hydroxy-phenyl)propionate transporter MhpT [Rhizobium oryzicola]|uniref:3-(3-hydroxy-phenyl)propionate transporter MhpT n=1 Tax=Rhizobium oryzicola TaxID=1232668 RepID=A0ABT8SXH5_9HYPH|nr:3-(3-hydroxy-phenyl)propionate transporter MhpT [Rhizobium oryzicola]MDO1582995.1 3-(3-hydroxy-phenyl)propionate transporter MhpT [Rhizobium oryzicola]
MSADVSHATSRKILSIAFLAAIIEGFDLQAAGVAAPKLAPAFGLTPPQIGIFFSAATIALIFGALLGGMFADRYGRRAGLAASLLLFGVFSLATSFAGSFEALIVIRFLTGVGLGGALPNLVSIAAEATTPEKRGQAVSIMYAGVPLGGAVASFVAMAGLHDDWKSIFIAGGILPILLIIPLMTMLPPLRVTQPAISGSGNRWRDLFAPGSLLPTLLLWVGFFFGLLIVYLLINWLPALMVSKGIDRTSAALIQILFNIGSAAGSLIAGRLLDGEKKALSAGLCFSFLIVSLVLLGNAPANVWVTAIAATMVGGGLLGAQAILYGIAPQCYPAHVRGTGVGFAIAAGRLGSVAGPLLAGGLVAAGRSPSEVLMAIVPVAIFSGVATVLLLVLRRRSPAVALA